MKTVSQEQKKSIVEGFKKSGISKAAFAKKVGISPRSLGRYLESFSSVVSQEKSTVERKYKVRSTGRIQLVYGIIGKLGYNASTSEIFSALVEKSYEAKLPKISKASGYAIICGQRKAWKKDHNIE